MNASRLIPVLLVLGAIGLFLAYTKPSYSGPITATRAEIAELDTALVAARSFKDKELELTRQRNLIPAEQLARLEAFLPDSVDNVQLIVDLNSLAARSGVRLSEFDIQGNTPGTPSAAAPSGGADAPATGDPNGVPVLGYAEPTESLELSVSATGTYAAFRTFLDGIENSLRPLDIIELSVEDSDTGVYTYDITFRLYWLR